MAIADLTTSGFVQQALAAGGITLSAAQLAHLSGGALTAASQAIRRWCNGRDFVRSTYDKIYTPAPDGRVALDQIPVNAVTRCSGGRTTALSITNVDTANYRANAQYKSTGDWDGGVTYTGITLTNWTGSGPNAVDLLYADYPTIAQLAAAINALGNGWAADVSLANNFGNWASSDLAADDAGPVGCLIGTDRGAELEVFAEDLASAVLDRDTGLIRVGRSQGGEFGRSWGPDWAAWDLDEGDVPDTVRIVYDAGFATVPYAVQQVCAEVLKAMLDRLGMDTTLTGESDGAYRYEQIAMNALPALSAAARQVIAAYRIHRA